MSQPASRRSSLYWLITAGSAFLVFATVLLIWLMGTPSEQVAVDPSGGVRQFPKSGVQLEIPPGATQRNVNVNLSVISTPPPAPEGASLLGNAYDIKSEVDVFDEPIRLTIPVPPNQWPSPNELVTVATWDEELRDWVPLGSELDEQQKTVSAWVSHFSKYAAINWNPNKPNIVEMRTTENFTIVALTNTAIVQRVAQLMEEARDLVVNQLGYRYQAEGKRIWVWITRFTEKDWLGLLDEPPATLRKFLFDKNIYLKASLNLSNPSSEGTPAHEFFHFVQVHGYLGKDNYEDNEKSASWWMEATAAWIKTKRAPNHAVEIYRAYSRSTKTELLKLPLDDPGAEDDVREYLAGVFANYLESRFGTEIIRRTWEILSAQVSSGQIANPLKAIEDALSERGEKLSDVYFNFALDYAYFRNSPWLSFLPAFKTEEVEVSTSQKTKRFSLPHMSCQFSRLNAQRDKGVLKVEANTDPNIRYAVIDESSKNVVQPGTGSGIQVAGFGANTKSAMLIACNTSLQDKSEFQFSYALGREVVPEVSVPNSLGYVSDYAGVLDAQTKARIEGLLSDLEQKTTAQIVVLTVKTTKPLDDFQYAVKVFDNWKIGQKGKDNGALFLVAAEDRRVRIVTGYGLASVLPDEKVGQILDNHVLPRFREGDLSRGIYEGVRVLASIIAQEAGENPIAIVETSMGTFKIELFADKVPNTVQNFIDLVNRGFYRDMIFHRVVPGFIIQTGDPTGTGRGGSGKTIKLETHPNLKHDGPGVVGMARARGEDASSQFYITLSEASHLDGNYAVFGRVIEGLDTVMRIGQVRVVEERPIEPVILKSITLETSGQETSTLTVCSSGCSFRRIQDAINAATPGTTIEIGPGTYYENIEITKSLTLLGQGEGQPQIRGSEAGRSVVLISGDTDIQVKIENLTITGAKLSTLTDACAGQRQRSFCSAGVLISGRAKVTLENSEISRNDADGVWAMDSAYVLINNTKISDNAQSCFAVSETTNIHCFGIDISGGSQVTVMNSAVSANAMTGVMVRNSAQAKIQSSTLSHNGRFGLVAQNSAEIQLENSVILQNGFGGVSVGNAAKVELHQSNIERNGVDANCDQRLLCNGVDAAGEAWVGITESSIRDNKGWGVATRLGKCSYNEEDFRGQVTLRGHNIIEGNSRGQVCLPEEQAGIQPPTSEGISIGYVNVEALGGMSIDEVRARLKRMSGKKPDLVLQRKDVIMFADHARVTDLTQEVRSGASIAVSASSLRKMAYINAEKVFQGYRRASEAVERFRTEAQKTQNELKALQDRFKRGLISQETFQREATRLQKELQDLDLQLTAEIQGDMLRAIEEIAREVEIDWVTQRKDVVLFANPKVVLDLTDLVIRKLNGEQIASELVALPFVEPLKRAGYVRTTTVLSKYEQTKSVQQRRADLRKKQQELQDVFKSLQDRFRRGLISEAEFQSQAARLQQESQRLELELTVQIHGEIIKVIEELAKRENYDIALNYEEAILFADEAKITDLTDQVISEINQEPRANTPAPSQGYSPQITFVDVPSQIPPETPIPISISFTDPDGDVRGVEILDCSFPVFFSNEEPRCLRVLDNDALQDANVEGVISGTIKITLKCIPFPFTQRRQQIILYDRQGYSSEPLEFTFQCIKQQNSK